MSHFTVGVIVEDPADLENALLPYCEGNEDAFEKVFYHTKESFIEEYRRYCPDKTDEEIWEMGCQDYIMEDDQLYCRYNPRARWDWWVIGGRWRYLLKVNKAAEHIKDRDAFAGKPRRQRGKNLWVDGAKIKDIKWADMNRPTQKDIAAHARFWDVVVEGEEKREDEDFGFHYSPNYYRELYKTKENYIMKENTFYTHDLLNGITDEWHTLGEMGWFGCDAGTFDTLEEYLEKFYDIIRRPEYQDCWFIVVDCHI